nr:hypothetical protein [Tanacetum cinerariifolium]
MSSNTKLYCGWQERRMWRRIWRIIVRIRMIRERSEEGGRGLVRREEEDAPEGQQPVVQAADTAVGEPLGLGYMALRRCELSTDEGQVPSTFDVRQSSRSVPEHQGAGRISAFREPTLTPPIPSLLSIGTPSSPEWSSGSFPVSPLSLVISTPVASTATSSPAASPDTVKAEDFTAELGAQERLEMRSFRRALEAWVGQTDAHRVALWHAMSDTQRENHDLRMQLAEERRERLELAYRVARIERRQEPREE